MTSTATLGGLNVSEIGQKVIAAVRGYAEADPDFVYSPIPDERDGPNKGKDRCLYVVDGQPSCIIGKGLWDAGLIDATIEGKSMNLLPFVSYSSRYFPCMEQMDDAELKWLAKVQLTQDGGISWGDAVAYADGEVTL